MSLSEIDEYILNAIRNWVWSGFYSPSEVDDMIEDILENGADEEMLRGAVRPEFEKKKIEEQNWPEVTDCDRLDSAFKNLDAKGVLCLHNAGYTMSDGHSDAGDELSEHPAGRYFGYCFYHGQDVESVIAGRGLMLAFDHVEGDVPDKLKVGVAVKNALENIGFSTEWDGTANKRIFIPNFDWKRRTQR